MLISGSCHTHYLVSCYLHYSIADLHGSFQSGRLFTQIENLTRYYAAPVLLIEFDEVLILSSSSSYFRYHTICLESSIRTRRRNNSR